MTRRAGISMPLFSMRSSRSWGIGEIRDIPLMARWLRAAHQSVLQILPLNEMAPSESSPYSALSAMAINPRYISVGALDGGAHLESEWQAEIDRLRKSPSIDHAGVRHLKERGLRSLFEVFYAEHWLTGSHAARALQAYLDREAWWIEEYTLYRALRRFAGEMPWTEWAPAYRDREPEALGRARRELAIDILFYGYIQWIADEQWRAVRESLPDLEILGDCPFMVTLDSADVWSRRGDFLLDASVGTPPDAFSETGQEWGLPPYNWDAARQSDFAWLRMRARRLASLYDGFRIDHLVGFYRTYIRPYDGREPFFLPATVDEQRALGEAVLSLMIDTGADVSVEDLGTVPAFVRESFAAMGLPGYKVLRWETSPPESYPALSVAMTGTHDTEPLALWWESLPAKEQEVWGLLDRSFTEEVRDGLLQRIYDAGSNLVLLPVLDVFGWRDRINQPATISESNWTFVLPWPVDTWGDEPVARDAADRLTAWGYRSGRWIPVDEE